MQTAYKCWFAFFSLKMAQILSFIIELDSKIGHRCTVLGKYVPNRHNVYRSSSNLHLDEIIPA